MNECTECGDKIEQSDIKVSVATDGIDIYLHCNGCDSTYFRNFSVDDFEWLMYGVITTPEEAAERVRLQVLS